LSDTSGGSITVDAEAVAGKSVWERRRLGLRLVPADRFAYALLAELRAYENLALTGVGENRYGPWWWLRRRLMRRTAAELFHSRQISGGGPLTRTRLLSGGNAQKLLLARELDDATRVLIAHSPTRGLDVRACQAVHRTLLEGVSNGAACLLISEDLDEVLQLATQVAVMSRGRLYGPFPQSGISRTRIGELMTAHA
jgi:simple sugar transport system ATP-binding protein